MNDEAANDRAVAEQGWGPTLRMSTLIFVRGVANRLSAVGGRRTGRAVGLVVTVAGAILGGYAKARGWV
jgi:hypothetical protein